jgi:hypothetical protein
MEEDAKLMGEDFVLEAQNIYLPSSFMGSKRWATEQFADSLTIAADLGSPTFFITITHISDWPEIKFRLRPGQDFSNIPSDVVCVFKQKLTLLEQSLKTETDIARTITQDDVPSHRSRAILIYIQSNSKNEGCHMPTFFANSSAS